MTSGHYASLRAALEVRGAQVLLLISAALCTAALLAAPPASALPQRGHAVSFAFASPGAQSGQLAGPSGVAVDEETGDVYVLDRGNNRIERFDGKGEFMQAWGYDVSREGAGGKKAIYEVCSSECKAGAAGTRENQLGPNSLAIAVDNSTGPEDHSRGDVYLVTEFKDEETQIDKFSAGGEPVEMAHKIRYHLEEGAPENVELEAGETHGLAVVPNGSVWLYYEKELLELSDTSLEEAVAEPRELELAGDPESGFGLAVDTAGNFYVGHQSLFGAGGQFANVVAKVDGHASSGEEPTLIPELDQEDTTGVAVNQLDVSAHRVDEENDAYISNVTGTQGSVAAFEPSGSLIQRLTAPGLTDPSSVAVDSRTGAVYVTDAQADDVDVFGLEEAGAPKVNSLSASEVTSESLRLDANVDPAGISTTVVFQYDTAPLPSPGEPCTAPCVEAVPGGQGIGEAFGDQHVDIAVRNAPATPLLAGAPYHYRVVARNKAAEGGDSVTREGTFTTPASIGRDIADARGWELVSPPQKEGANVESLSAEGPLVQASLNGSAISYGVRSPIGAPEGNLGPAFAQMLSIRGPQGWSGSDIDTPGGPRGGLLPGYQEYRSFNQTLSLALVQPFALLLSSGGSGLAEPPLSPPLTQTEREDGQEATIYLRDDVPPNAREPESQALEALEPEACEPASPETCDYAGARANGIAGNNPGFLPLVTALNDTGEANSERTRFGTQVRLVGETEDLKHVVLSSNVALTHEFSGPGENEGFVEHNLYEWTAGSLKPVNVLRSNEVAKDAQLGQVGGESGHVGDVRHAIANDGSRVFWSTKPGGGQGSSGHLFMRDTATEKTLWIDRKQGSTEDEPTEPGDAIFQTASADGSRVFFTDTQRLTPESGAEENRPDLYVCDITEVPATRELECHLTDLTQPLKPVQDGGEGANVQGLVLGASEDGSDVYFVANGVLNEGETNGGEEQPGTCWHNEQEVGGRPPADASCNLYVERYNSQPGTDRWEPHPTFIASLSSNDFPDWGGGEVLETGTPELGYLTARSSPNGRYLAFMSQRSLTGYDNEDASSQRPGERLDEEVFLYDAQSGRRVCVSCDPSGARPSGVIDPIFSESEETGAVSQEGQGLLVDRLDVWGGHWLAGSIPGWTMFDIYGASYQSRYLSDSGRLFFNSPADLVHEASNGKEDVYEYEPQGIPSGQHECNAASQTFAGASGGCVGLISSGTSVREAAFLDASESGGEGAGGEALQGAQGQGGGDVFFLTAAQLVPQDIDASFDVYDAHECTGGSPCIASSPARAPEACESTESCRPYSSSSAPGTAASASSTGSGNVLQQEALGSKSTQQPQQKPLTRAQKLAKALKTCKKIKRRKQRASCEASARKRYGPPKKSKKKAKKASTRATAVGRATQGQGAQR